MTMSDSDWQLATKNDNERVSKTEAPITVKPKENATINISSGASGLSTTFAPQKNSF